MRIILEATREQRSPQFGLLGGNSDYYDYNDDVRYNRYGSKRKYHHYNYYKPFNRPHGIVGGHGCRGYGCGGGYVLLLLLDYYFTYRKTEVYVI